MFFKKTVIWVVKQQLVLALLILFFVVNRNEWQENGHLSLILFILLYQVPVLVTGIASLFSKKHELEGALERSIKMTSIPMQLVGWTFVAAATLPGLYLLPFPTTIVYYITIFNFFYAIGVTITQRLGLGIIGGIAQAEESSVFGLVIRYATAIYFFPVYLTLSRISSLPVYVRKPLALITAVTWGLLMFVSGSVFDG